MRRRKFAEEMTTSGMVAAIRAEAGNLRYEYYQPLDDAETILLIDSWTDQAAIDGGQPDGRNTPVCGGKLRGGNSSGNTGDPVKEKHDQTGTD